MKRFASSAVLLVMAMAICLMTPGFVLAEDVFSYIPVPDGYRASAENPGELRKVEYEYGGGSKYAYVYVPYGYDAGTQYDIFYLMHGGGGGPETFFGSDTEPNEFKNVLDHMIGNGDIRPVLVVAPTFYPAGNTDVSVENSGVRVEQFPTELITALIPAVEGTYSTYAEDTTQEGLKASRNHRAFGGFSMGAVSTWYVFTDCMDAFSAFVPVSGDCWEMGQLGGSSDPEGTAEYLNGAVKAAGYDRDGFTIYAATGSEDIAFEMLTFQVEAMKKQTEIFSYSDFIGEGNLHLFVAEGKDHTTKNAGEYVYDAWLALYGT